MIEFGKNSKHRRGKVKAKNSNERKNEKSWTKRNEVKDWLTVGMIECRTCWVGDRSVD